MWPILIVSIVALTVVIERIFWWGGRWFRRDPKRIEKVFTAIEVGDVAEASRLSRDSRDPVLRMMWNGLSSASRRVRWLMIERAEPEVRGLLAVEQSTGTRGQHAAPAARQGEDERC